MSGQTINEMLGTNANKVENSRLDSSLDAYKQNDLIFYDKDNTGKFEKGYVLLDTKQVLGKYGESFGKKILIVLNPGKSNQNTVTVDEENSGKLIGHFGKYDFTTQPKSKNAGNKSYKNRKSSKKTMKKLKRNNRK